MAGFRHVVGAALAISLRFGVGARLKFFALAHNRQLDRMSVLKMQRLRVPAMSASSGVASRSCEVVPCQNNEFAVDVLPAGKKGMGVFAAEHGLAGTWVCRYSGELVSYEQVRRRYIDSYPEYLFEINDDPMKAPAKPGYRDAMDSKHFSRYFNHAQHANLNFTVDSEQGHIDFYLQRDVQAGEELCFDYGESYWTGSDYYPEDDSRNFTAPADYVPWISNETVVLTPVLTPKNMQELNETLTLPESDSRAAFLRSLEYFGAERVDENMMRIPLGLGPEASFLDVNSKEVAWDVLKDAASACLSQMEKLQGL
mmetsp:Transcript_84303/g.132799  ORF Transcript_84303/g.132799 Transcript_84303/m.132799 type:complete len:312 (-) Transcript_84303:66-1001(-)